MIRCRWFFHCDRNGKREALELLTKARREGYVLWASVRYEIEGARHHFKNRVMNMNWDLVRSAIEHADRDIWVYDVCERFNF